MITGPDGTLTEASAEGRDPDGGRPGHGLQAVDQGEAACFVHEDAGGEPLGGAVDRRRQAGRRDPGSGRGLAMGIYMTGPTLGGVAACSTARAMVRVALTRL